MKFLVFILTFLLAAAPAFAVTTTYTDEAAYQDALGAGGYLIVEESFEDDALWGHVRTTVVDGPHTAPSVTAGYLTWSANTPTCGITTGQGPAYIGQWGFYQRPHGDPNNGYNDGFIISTASGGPMFAFGGWIETNTFGARMNVIIDGVTVIDFEDQPLDYAHQFYGVIVTEGFESLEVIETETMPGDEWYYIFADHFTVAIDQEVGAPTSLPAATAQLLPNVPNPFNPRTRIGCELTASGPVDLRLYDVSGRLVRTLLAAEYREAGTFWTDWDGRDGSGRALPAGAYRCELTAGKVRATRWLTLVK